MRVRRTTSREYLRKPRTRAVATVELAFIMPVLLLFLFGIIEFGLLFKDSLVLQEAAREGARVAALGAPPPRIREVVQSSAPTLGQDNLSIEMQYRTWEGAGWSDWCSLGVATDNSSNNAPPGSQVRVRVEYAHPLITGGLFSWMATNKDNNTVTLRSSAIARRE
ncbi:MAG: pilus assembly protein [Armatimonadetes bacterium]|nr:pilus assembly protein [Armatimonadota bacterium]